MRDKKQKKTALLVTDDPAVLETVKVVTGETGDSLQHLKTFGDAMCVILDAYAGESFAVVDFDTTPSHLLLATASGVLPVIAVSKEAKPWLRSMLQHRRIGATLSKPISREALRNAFRRIRDFHSVNSHWEICSR